LFVICFCELIDNGGDDDDDLLRATACSRVLALV